MAPAELAPVLAPSSALLSVEDPTRTRTVYLAILLLVLLGVAMIVLTVWLVRRTRTDPVVLAPLEVMGERSWRRSADPEWRQARLDEARPPGAVTLAMIAPFLAADADEPEPVGADPTAPDVAVEGELHGPPAPHALTSAELDEILQRFGGLVPPDPDSEVEAEAEVEVDGEVDRDPDSEVEAELVQGDVVPVADAADEQATHG